MGYAEDVGSGDARSALSNTATGFEVDFSKKEPTTEEIEQMRGAVKFFDDRKGIGKIVPDGDGPEVFFHRTAIVDREPARLVESEPVEFDAEEEEKGPKATRVTPLESRVRGTVDSFDKGIGRIRPDGDGDLLFVHWKSILGTGFKRLEADQPVEFVIKDDPRGPKAERVLILDHRPPLERFAMIHNVDDHLAQLADLAQKENWSYRHAESQRPYPILRSFVYYTFTRLQEEGKIAETRNDKGQRLACFNTGLVTERQEAIFGLFTEARKRYPDDQDWFLKGFHRESDHWLTAFPKRPDLVNYFTDPSELLYDTRIELRVDVEHVIGDNKTRFPKAFQENEYALRGALEGAIVAAKKRIRRNYKTAVPQFHRGQLQLLLPLCLSRPEQADLALVVAKVEQVYRGSTVLTLDMAYNNARLIARPDTEWLDP